MRLDKTRRVTGQVLRLRTSIPVASAVLGGLFEWRDRLFGPDALRTAHAAATLALTGGLFIISASEK
jgi:hypothetical protein